MLVLQIAAAIILAQLILANFKAIAMWVAVLAAIGGPVALLWVIIHRWRW
jgi:hypothetical protein